MHNISKRLANDNYVLSGLYAWLEVGILYLKHTIQYWFTDSEKLKNVLRYSEDFSKSREKWKDEKGEMQFQRIYSCGGCRLYDLKLLKDESWFQMMITMLELDLSYSIYSS